MDDPIQKLLNTINHKRVVAKQAENARVEGRLAFSNDKSLSANPYRDINRFLEAKWIEGWSSAKDARETKVSSDRMGNGILILALCSVLLIPAIFSDSQNRNRQVKFSWRSAVVPEKYGYLAGLFNFDTLEIAEKTISIKKHSLLGDNNITLPIRQIRKVVFGTFIGQRYIKLNYSDDWFGGSYKIYINPEETNAAIISLFNDSQLIIENQWYQ